MSAQYDKIGAKYANLTAMAPEQIEHDNIRRIIEPRVKGANVLELACGLGHHSRRMVDMEASHVVAVDISSGMIESAKADSSAEKYKGRIDFEVGDCFKPINFEDRPFDLVLACWLLNYAPDGKVLADTFRCASSNLKKGGIFVGSTVAPTEDPAGFVEKLHSKRPKAKGMIWTDVKEPIKDGIKIQVTALLGDKDEDNVQFDCYHLKESVFKQAAKEGGFADGISWEELEMPEFLKGSEQEDFLRSFVTMPECGIFVCTKR